MPSTDLPLDPLLLEPIASRRLWGGRRLAPLAGLDPGADPTPIGEIWSAWSGNFVVNGPYRGLTLGEAIDRMGGGLLGSAAVARYGLRMPLLAKLIDADAPLSIQVHPDDAYATSVEASSGHLGKGEAWCILQAAPGAEIVWGWRRDVGADEVRVAVAEGRLEALLRTVPVAAGDVVYNPPGRVHAIGAGTLLYEIQQDSDLTYRLYDYGRLDADGRPRDLHLDRALDVADLTALEGDVLHAEPPSSGWGTLLTTPFFVLERADLGGPLTRRAVRHSLTLLTLAQGGVTVRWGEQEVALRAGRTLVMAAAGPDVEIVGDGVLFAATVPPADRTAGA